jgi:V/A-type H+-transporting ATPase subunit C
MKSRLLSRHDVESLAHAGSLQALINALAKTTYRTAIEAALVRATGMDCVSRALGRDLTDTLSRARTFYRGRPAELVSVVLRAYDVGNLKTILRGLSKHATPDEITAALVPAGELMPSLLSRLARAPEPRAAIDMLATMRLPIARPLLKLRAEQPGAGPFAMEIALDQWRFEHAFNTVKKARRGARVLRPALEMEADLTNLLTALRFAHAPAERQLLRRRIGSDDLSRLFVGPGSLPFALLVRIGELDRPEGAAELLSGTPYGSPLGELDRPEGAAELLSGTPYGSPLGAGLASYSQSGRLSDLEKELRRFRLHWMSRLIIRDPLGIGVPLGYFALKINEVSNLHWVAQGINLGLGVDAIKAELEFIDEPSAGGNPPLPGRWLSSDRRGRISGTGRRKRPGADRRLAGHRRGGIARDRRGSSGTHGASLCETTAGLCPSALSGHPGWEAAWTRVLSQASHRRNDPAGHRISHYFQR